MTQTELEKYMLLALNFAEQAKTEGEVPVGAIIVINNKVVSSAYNQVEKDSSIISHAEILAIIRAEKIIKDWRLCEATLFTTLEPCPMCCSAAILSRVKHIVFGAYDIRLGSCGSQFDLSQHPVMPNNPKITGGILKDECSKLLKDFFMEIR